MNNLKLDRRTITIGLIVLAVILFLPRLLGNNDTSSTSSTSNSSNSSSTSATTSGVTLGEIVTARTLDRDGCAASRSSTFGPSDSIYIVAEDSEVKAGTAVFVRLYFDDQAIEDLPEITADQDYESTCINFVFEPTSGASFDRGDYEAEFVVNGNQAGSVTFRVQ